MASRESAPTLTLPQGHVDPSLSPELSVAGTAMPNTPGEINWGTRPAAEPPLIVVSPEQIARSQVVESVVAAGKGATHLHSDVKGPLAPKSGFKSFGEGPKAEHDTIGMGIPVTREINNQSSDWREHANEAVSFTGLVEPEMIVTHHPARTEKGKRGRTRQIPGFETEEINPLAGQAKKIINPETGAEEDAVRFRYQFGYSERTVADGVHKVGDVVEGELPEYKEFNGNRSGQQVLLGVDLPKSVADKLQASIISDPSTARTVAERLFLERSGGIVTADNWFNGGERGAPVRPPYEELKSWDIKMITGTETTAGGHQNKGRINKDFKVEKLSVPQPSEAAVPPEPSPGEAEPKVPGHDLVLYEPLKGEVARRPQELARRAPEAMAAALRTEGDEPISQPRAEFMPKSKAETRKTPIRIGDTSESPLSAQLYRDAARKGRSDLVGLTWEGDGATFRVATHNNESRTVDKFGVDMGKYHRGTQKAAKAWRGSRAKNWKGQGLFPPKFSRYTPPEHESLHGQMQGFSPTRTNGFVTPGNSLKLGGFQARSHERGGMGLYGVTTMETTQQSVNRRSVEVIRDGQVTRVLDFNNDAELIVYLNKNDGSKPPGGATKDSLRFGGFAWEEKQAASTGKKDIIPALTEQGHPVSLTAIDQQRRRLGLQDRTGMTWTESHGEKSQIVKEYTVSKKPNNYTAYEIKEQHIEVMTERKDSRGNVYQRSIIFTPEGLQRHFDGLAKKQAVGETDPHWELAPLPETDMQGRILRQEEVQTKINPEADLPAHYQETIGRFATALVVEKPKRNEETDPGLSMQEAIGLLASPDHADGWEDRVRQYGSGEGEAYDNFREEARKLQATVNELGSNVVGETADGMLKEVQTELTRLGMHDAAQTESISSIYAALAHSHMHNLENPEATVNDQGLSGADPFEMSQSGQLARQQIIDAQVAQAYATHATMPGKRQRRTAAGIEEVDARVLNEKVTRTLPRQIQAKIENMLLQHQPEAGQILTMGGFSVMGRELRFGWYDTETEAKILKHEHESKPKHKV